MAAPRQSLFSRVMAILRLVVFTVIAVALVKFVFFPTDSSAGGEELEPSFAVPQMTVTATTGTITNTLKIPGTIIANPATPVQATAEGEVTTVFVGDGEVVEKGAPILEVRREVAAAEPQSVGPDGEPVVSDAEPTYQYARVVATASGRVSLTVLKGQVVSIGDELGNISPGTFSVSAPLAPEQIYRINTLPKTATVTIKDGPAPFECTGVKLDTPNQTDAEEAKSAQVSVTCAIPSDQRVFSGLAITLDLVAGEASDVLTLPVTAVEGRYGQGFIYLPGDDPMQPVKQEVTLGITDGTLIEIREGLDAETEVLEFTPVARPEDSEGCDPESLEGC